MSAAPTQSAAELNGRLPCRIVTLLVTACACVLPMAVCDTSAGDEKRSVPNIVLIVADDLGYGELGCYGQKIIETPNIDRLAKEGVRLTQFYSGSPVCASARCVLMTGLHSGHAYIRTNRATQPEGQFPIPDETVTLAELLKTAGYKTAAIGKWGLGMFDTTGNPNDPPGNPPPPEPPDDTVDSPEPATLLLGLVGVGGAALRVAARHWRGRARRGASRPIAHAPVSCDC